jgi:hypothetical protein
MLSFPISEYLASRPGWEVTPELHYKKVAEERDLSDFWCDFAARRKSAQHVGAILETKYLKGSAQGRARDIQADIIKLLLPPGRRLRRYFLLAGAVEHFPDEGADLFFDRELFGLKVGKGCFIKPRREINKPELAKFLARLGANGIERVGYVPENAFVTCRANEEISAAAPKRFRVMVWSIGLANEPRSHDAHP